MKTKQVKGYIVGDPCETESVVYTEATWAQYLHNIRHSKALTINDDLQVELVNLDRLIAIIDDITSDSSTLVYMEEDMTTVSYTVQNDSRLYQLLLDVCPDELRKFDLPDVCEYYVILAHGKDNLLDKLKIKREGIISHYTKLKDKTKDFTPGHTTTMITMESCL